MGAVRYDVAAAGRRGFALTVLRATEQRFLSVAVLGRLIKAARLCRGLGGATRRTFAVNVRVLDVEPMGGLAVAIVTRALSAGGFRLLLASRVLSTCLLAVTARRGQLKH